MDPDGELPDLWSQRTFWFTGGPLDGRVLSRDPADPAPPTVRYVRLHGPGEGTKVVHHYDLHDVGGEGGEYRVRSVEESPGRTP